MKVKRCFLIAMVLVYSVGFSQDTIQQKLSINEITKLALENNQALKVSRKSIDIAQQQTEIYKQNQLPNVSFDATAMYLGDAVILDKDFSKQATVDMPHFGNTFSVQAQQVIYKGNAINNTIEIGSLQEQLAGLDVENDELSIKFLVIANYLDLYKLYNQKQVYLENIKLAKKRIENVTNFYNQGMVTRNEVIRGNLLLASLNQAVVTINSNITILNKQLTTALGLPENTQIIPDDATLNLNISLQEFASYKEEALKNHPDIKSVQLQKDLAETSLDITKSEKLPTLAGFGGYNMQRPITSTNPITDMYSNSWQVGVSLSYDIESLYKTPKKVKLDQLKIDQILELEEMEKQNLEVAVKAAYLKYNEAVSQRNTYLESKRLAEENYRIIEKKYLNQLALVVDMLDASNSKLDAELQYINSEINIIYTYYNLLKTTGEL
ncbi:TolC family protein [Lutibacter sp. B1]|uniref:TolC family protein n=1 Tax=Lutibacter sp. B1 TaxID=2725996 RepID=UPI00145731F5|nr:TolC family protein [Lutibacter sp. B1]NLP58332.1 TolC family protein [Lutibacter sp. B1]